MASPSAPVEQSTLEQDLQEREYAFPYHYVAQFREHFSHTFVDSWAINYASTIEFLLHKLGGETRARIVDIGCGDGRFTRELALACPDSTVVGIDYSRRAVALAAAMNPDLDNLRFAATDITAGPCAQPFDLAVLMEVFEHVPLEHAESFMAAARDQLRQGAVLYVTVPHANKPLEYKHFQHFSVARLLAYLQPHFEIAEVVPFERRAWSRWWLEKLLSNRIYVLNNRRLLSAAYRWYKRRLFFCESERSCQRIFVRAIAK